MSAIDWTSIILESPDQQTAWQRITTEMLSLARGTVSPVELHEATVVPDRILAEAAWELWHALHDCTERTADAMVAWHQNASPAGRAILVLDALSLRELPLLLGGAERRGITPSDIRITSAEIPTDTDAFAHALGASSRASLSNDGKGSGFRLANIHTDVSSIPFRDCVAGIPSLSSVFLWHQWLDDLIHLHKKSSDQVATLATKELQGDDFWALVDRMRQGRDLLITGDHGYAATKLFSSQETDEEIIDILRTAFGAKRCVSASEPWSEPLMPPFVHSANGHHVVMGQRKWTVQSGFPPLCHGGLTLLEALVPFVVLPAKV